LRHAHSDLFGEVRARAIVYNVEESVEHWLFLQPAIRM
jgi:hypothetical protein